MNFLVVDDSSTMRKIVGVALAGAGYAYTEAENGRVGLEKARAAKFDCVILDVNMPEMNGIEFLKARSDDALSQRASRHRPHDAERGRARRTRPSASARRTSS